MALVIAFVGSVGTGAAAPSGGAVTIGFSGVAVQAGDLVVLHAGFNVGSPGTTSVTDTTGNTWTRRATKTASTADNTSELWSTVTTGAITTITVSNTGGATSIEATAGAFRNAQTAPIETQTTNTTASPNITGDYTPSGQGDLVVGGISRSSGTASTVASPATQFAQSGFVAGYVAYAGYIITASGSTAVVDVQWTTTSVKATAGASARWLPIGAAVAGAALSGSGTLAATAVTLGVTGPSLQLRAGQAGLRTGYVLRGGIAPAGAPSTATAALSGAGTLTAITGAAVTAAPGFTGAGTLAAATGTLLIASVTLSGAGTLAATTGSARTVSAALAGSGALSATASHGTGLSKAAVNRIVAGAWQAATVQRL